MRGHLRQCHRERRALGRRHADRCHHLPLRWFFDTEFDEDGRTIDLISVGLVSDMTDDDLKAELDRHQMERAACSFEGGSLHS